MSGLRIKAAWTVDESYAFRHELPWVAELLFRTVFNQFSMQIMCL